MRSVRRVILAGILILLLGGSLIMVNNPARQTTIVSLGRLMAATDMIVVLDDLEIKDSHSAEGFETFIYSGTVIEVHAIAEVFQAQPMYGDVSKPQVPRNGSGLVVQFPTYAPNPLSAHDFLDPHYVFVSYWPPDAFPERTSPWTMEGIAISGSASTEQDEPPALQFIGDGADALNDELVRLLNAAGRPASRAPELLRNWVAEVAAHRRHPEGPQGPIAKLYSQSQDNTERTVSATERWHAQGRNERQLLPDVAPPSVLAGLNEYLAIVEVTPEASDSGRYLVVRTPLGISEVSELSRGSHVARIFAKTDETWEVSLSDEPSSEGATVATTGHTGDAEGVFHIRISKDSSGQLLASVAELTPSQSYELVERVIAPNSLHMSNPGVSVHATTHSRNPSPE